MENSSEIGAHTKDLITYLRAHHKEEDAQGGGVTTQSETTVLSREIGAFYERIRYAVDNKEEHFFRRYAIRRVIRRVSLFSDSAEKLLTTLVADLDRGGYLSESALSPVRLEQTYATLVAFTALQNALRKKIDIAEYHHLRKFLLDIIAGALEDALYDTTREEGVAVMMARSALESATGEDLAEINEEKKKIFFYVASWRSVFSADSALLRYKLWLFAHPNWDDQRTYPPEQLAGIFRKEVMRINQIIDHPFGRKLLPRLHNLSIAHTLIYDAVREYDTGLDSLLADPAQFQVRIRGYMNERYRRNMARVRRRSFQAILYIFITKALLAVMVESAYVLLWKQPLNYLALGINLTVHPTLLSLLTGGVQPPKQENTNRAVALTEAVVYGRQLPQLVFAKEKKGIIVDIALGCYIFLLSASMWGIISALHALQFHLIDVVFFVLFLLLVLYFGYRIRFSAYRMRLEGGKEGVLRSITELLLLPLVSLGRWMSVRFENINVAVFFLDFVIESPLRLILRFFDTFSSLVDKKRDEMYTP